MEGGLSQVGILNSFKLFRRRGSEFLCVLLATRDRQRYLEDVPVTLCFSVFVAAREPGQGQFWWTSCLQAPLRAKAFGGLSHRYGNICLDLAQRACSRYLKRFRHDKPISLLTSTCL